MEQEKEFNYKDFSRWWKRYKEDEIEESKRRDEITQRAEVVLLESEKLVRDWMESYIPGR